MNVRQHQRAYNPQRVLAGNHRAGLLHAILKNSPGHAVAIEAGDGLLKQPPVDRDPATDLADPAADDPVFGAAVRAIGAHSILLDLVEWRLAGKPVPFVAVPEVVWAGRSSSARKSNEIRRLICMVGIGSAIVVAVEPVLFALRAGHRPVGNRVSHHRGIGSVNNASENRGVAKIIVQRSGINREVNV